MMGVGAKRALGLYRSCAPRQLRVASSATQSPLSCASERATICSMSVSRLLGCFALFTVGDVYASVCRRGAYVPFSAQRRSRALFWL